MIKFFDLDGTLFWSAEYIKDSYLYAYNHSGLNIPDFTKNISSLYSLSLKNYLKLLNVDEILIDDYSSILSRIKNLSFSKFSHLLIPNYELLNELKNNQSTSYVVSNASFKTALNYFDFFKIKFPEKHIYTREKLIETKPSKLAYKTLTKLFNDNEEFIVYEDSEEGIFSAKEAGISNIIRVSFDVNRQIWGMKKYVSI